MAPKEAQRTHIDFDGLGDAFGALATELIFGKVEGCQRPNGRKYISAKVGSGLFWYLLALWEEGSDDDGARNT